MREVGTARGVEGCDAVTSATWSASEVEGEDAATGASWVDREGGGFACAEESCISEKGASSFDDEVQEVIDAVTGATWGTRNQIMEDMFHKRLDRDALSVPDFAPPGEAL